MSDLKKISFNFQYLCVFATPMSKRSGATCVSVLYFLSLSCTVGTSRCGAWERRWHSNALKWLTWRCHAGHVLWWDRRCSNDVSGNYQRQRPLSWPLIIYTTSSQQRWITIRTLVALLGQTAWPRYFSYVTLVSLSLYATVDSVLVHWPIRRQS